MGSQEVPYLRKHIAKHLGSESARVGVVTTAMVRVDECKTAIQLVNRRVPEFVFRLAQFARLDYCPMSDATQSQYNSIRR